LIGSGDPAVGVIFAESLLQLRSDVGEQTASGSPANLWSM
jgi:hypothetical protein